MANPFKGMGLGESLMAMFIPETLAGLDARREKKKHLADLDALLGLGLEDDAGITWNGPRGAPSGNFTEIGAPIQMAGAAPDLMPSMPRQGFDPRIKLQAEMDRKQDLMKLFPEESAAMMFNNAFAAPKIEEVSPGASLVRRNPDGTVNELYTAPTKAEDFKVGATRELKRGDQTVTQEYQGNQVWKDIGTGATHAAPQVANWEPMTEEEKRARGVDINTPYKIDRRTGNYEMVSTGTKFNNDQNKAAGFANTMSDAETRIGDLGQFDPSTIDESLFGQSNVTASPQYQQYKQAALDWTLALLRHESGANVPDTEAEKYWTTYFPQFGDSKEVKAQKLASRASKMKGVVSAAGGAFESLRKGSPGATTDDRPQGAPKDARKAKNGKWYSADPLRPGMWVEW